MKKYLNNPLFSLTPEKYLTLIVFLGPCLYFLSGVNIDMYSPSLPTIATFFHATIVQTKNTISIYILGWSLGAFIFGILIDSIGRKRALLIGMFFYVMVSVLAPFCETIYELMFIRFVQAFFIASIIAARVLIADLLTGKRFTIAILYTSLGYGIGPVVGPFFGGLLQYYFNWQATFIALTIIGTIILFLLFAFVKESIAVRHPLKFLNIAKRCYSVLSHKKFVMGAILGGVTQVQLMIYPTVGPFIVEKILHQSVLVYGNSALIVGGAYLTGTLMGRALLKYFSSKQICDIGFFILITGLPTSFLFAMIAKIELTTIMLPLILSIISAGLIFPNILGANLKQFAHSAGIAMAIQASVLLLVSAIGIFCISHIHITRLFQFFEIYLVLTILEVLIFYGFYHTVFSSD
ncbi:MAG TPA: MFS transporter [Coxiellaceae bacterium]|nr:MAG: hypothetical protein A3E81_08625 [Gammaproteobacteria bacterium RIFCSPHIGHO2_12_FULL_36_30]HLB56171.1 MFS transporter [Coxiellaceae bacterium]